MGAHINAAGKFQSDKYPTTPPDCVPLKVTDPTAQDLLWEYARRRRSIDAEFSDDLGTRLRAVGYAPRAPEPSGTCATCSSALGSPSPCAITHDFSPGAYPLPEDWRQLSSMPPGAQFEVATGQRGVVCNGPRGSNRVRVVWLGSGDITEAVPDLRVRSVRA